jgi:hypothetical protein
LLLSEQRAGRAGLLAIALLAALVAPDAASAHSRRPAVALDYRLRVPAQPLPGVSADVLDADRELRLTVAPAAVLVVRGLVGEPMLRFDGRGVWVNDASATAAADKLARAGGTGWRKLTSAHTFAWHDHRLSPPRLAAGKRAAWSLPVQLDGRAASLRGVFLRVPRPALWPWLVGLALAAAALLAVGRTSSARRGVRAVACAGTAAAAALVATIGFTTGDPLSGGSQWFELACTAALALAAALALRARDASARSWAASAIGAAAVAFTLPSLGVFWHGVVVSSLPAAVVRALDAVALVAGVTAVGLGLAAIDERPATRRRRVVAKGVR